MNDDEITSPSSMSSDQKVSYNASILELMIKNVTRDNDLTPIEIQVSTGIDFWP